MADDLTLAIKVAMESQSFQTQISDMNRQMKVVQSEFSAASTKLGEFGNSTDGLKAKASALGQQLDIQKQIVAKYAEQHQKAKETLEDNVKKNEELKQKVTDVTSAYNASVTATGKNSEESKKLKVELEELNKKYKDGTNVINNNIKSVDNYAIKLNNAQSNTNKLENEIEQTNKALQDNGKELEDVSKKTDISGKNFEGLGTKISNFGMVAAAGIAAVGVAIGAVVVAGASMSDDLQKALNGVQSSTGLADNQMADMKETMLDIYNNNFGESFEDIGNSMKTVNQQTGATGEELKKLTENALLMRDTFDFEVNESVRSANMLMKQFGISGDEAYNLIAQGAQNGLDKNGDLLDTINEYSVQFQQLGFNSDEMFNMLVNGSKEGTWSVDKLGDAVKEFGIRTKDGSKGTTEAFQALGLDSNKLSADFAKGGETGKQAFEEVNKKLLELKDPMQQNTLGVALYGTQWEDLGVKGITALTNVNGNIDKTNTNLQKINEVKYNTFGEAMTGIKRNLETGILLPIAEKILPILSKFSQWMTENMPSIKDIIGVAMTAVGNAFNIVGDIVDKTIMPIFNSLWTWIQPNIPLIKQIFEESFSFIGQAIQKVVDVINTNVMPVFKVLFDWIQPNIPIIKSIFEQAFNFISTVIFPIFNTAIDVITTKVLPALADMFKWIVENILPIFTDAWKWLSETIIPMLQSIFEKIMPPIQEILNNLGTLFTVIVEKIKENLEKMKGVFDFIFPFIKGIVEGVIASIGTVIEGLVNVLSGVIEFVTGVFTGDWQKAFEGVRDIFGGIFESLVGLVKAPINIIIGLINGMLEHIGNIKIKIPSVPNPLGGEPLFGGGSIGFPHIPDIPYLATGGIINRPTLAVVGEAGREAVMPLDRNTGWIDELASKLNSKGNCNQPIYVTVVSQLDGREIARVTAPAMSEELGYLNNRNNFAYGRG
jgi:phage-related minor tail protein